MVDLSNEASISNTKSVVTYSFRNCFASGNSIHVESWDVRFPCLDQEGDNQLEVSF